MNNLPSGKNTYVAISDNHAVRVRAYTRPKAIVIAAKKFVENIKGWQPEHGGIVDKSKSKVVRQYLNEHQDINWIDGGVPVDGK